MSGFFIFSVHRRSRGDERDVEVRSGLSGFGDGSHEVPSAAGASTLAAEFSHQTSQIHGGRALRGGRHGLRQR